ncbi:hypothetical protein PIB30_066351 [Stylosanthes scabra]|uniref:Uncharacterized protein n=1 Tax=Stylosanthes scabra TaxID=79078 RepID=A0ABU6VN76_9FABA|nr:hypothetical protein [Stylosanthes scabra]
MESGIVLRVYLNGEIIPDTQGGVSFVSESSITYVVPGFTSFSEFRNSICQTLVPSLPSLALVRLGSPQGSPLLAGHVSSSEDFRWVRKTIIAAVVLISLPPLISTLTLPSSSYKTFILCTSPVDEGFIITPPSTRPPSPIFTLLPGATYLLGSAFFYATSLCPAVQRLFVMSAICVSSIVSPFPALSSPSSHRLAYLHHWFDSVVPSIWNGITEQGQ